MSYPEENDNEWPQDQPENGGYDDQYDQEQGQYQEEEEYGEQQDNFYDDGHVHEQAEEDPYTSLLYQIQDNDPSCVKTSFFNMGIGDGGAEEIAEALNYGPNTNIILMDVGMNEITDAGFSKILPALAANESIRHLWMRDNWMGPEGAAALADLLTQNQRLSELSLGRNKVSASGATDIAASLRMNNTLTALWMYNNEVGDDGAIAIANTLSENTGLNELYLGGNAITEEGARTLAYALLPEQNTTLTCLELSRNQIGNNGARAIAHSLDSNSTLTELDLRANGIRFASGQALIAAAFRDQSNLVKLDLRGNSFTADELTMLEDLVERLKYESGRRNCTVLLNSIGNFSDRGDGERGPLLRGNRKDSRFGESDKGDDVHELYDDVYSIMFLSAFPSKPFFYSIFTYTLKTLLFTLVSIDLLNDGTPTNKIAIPSGVSTLVRIAQFFMLIVTVAMQEDLMASLALVNVRYHADIQRTYPGATKVKWILGSICRLLDGIFSLGINFCILVQATSVLGMFLNFAALHFLGSVDNVAFQLAGEGYFGDRVEEAAKAAQVATLPLEEDGIWRSLDTVGFVVTYFACLTTWSVLTTRQMNGAFACQSFNADLGTEVFGNIQPDALAGVYSQVGNRKDSINGRVVWMQDVARTSNKGMFAYCEKGEVWGLILITAESNTPDPCNYQMYSNNAVDEFDVTTVSEWYYRSLNDGSRQGTLASDVFLQCLDDLEPEESAAALN